MTPKTELAVALSELIAKRLGHRVTFVENVNPLFSAVRVGTCCMGGCDLFFYVQKRGDSDVYEFCAARSQAEHSTLFGIDCSNAKDDTTVTSLDPALIEERLGKDVYEKFPKYVCKRLLSFR